MEIKSYSIEDLGGGTMAFFGEFKDGTFFSGNEEGLNTFKKSDKFLYMGDVEYSDEEMTEFYNENLIETYGNETELHKKVIKEINF